ncbi:hypothetical protein O6H91_17G010800 [Diphasiastrum complanatum]|uniref:Uncharacterized protein n=1 Tax=Diphasiastrum complanatum TaxID=34168 RepID=A0ACC2B424_DIPCM|nr:hypothetical protein O6H91_17G010800 [Diphasiastrum complanatum]
MTQKGNLFKGQQKKNLVANRHGKGLQVRKGKVLKAPTKKTHEDQLDKVYTMEVSKFINQANEVKAATLACKEGARLRLVKAPTETKPKKVVLSKKSAESAMED